MTLLKDNNYKEINVALLSLEADIKNKMVNFDTSVIDKQLVEINNRIDKINAGGNNTSAQINDIRYEIEDINSKLKGNSAKIENIEQKLTDIFSADKKVTDFNTTTDSGIYYWLDDAANKPGTDYGVLLVNKYDDGGNGSIWINQVAYGTNSKIYFRQNINSTGWTEWKAVAFTTDIENTTTKTLSLNTVSTGTTKYIKLGTFHWYDKASLRCRLYGNSFEDDVNINILSGDANWASVCGYYSTNSMNTKAIIVKRGDSWNSDIEIYLQVMQFTTLNIDVTIGKNYQDRINISESTTAPSGKLEEIAFNNLNGMFTGNIDAKNLTLRNGTIEDLNTFGNEPLSIGTPSGINLGIDRNSIQARNNGAADVLYLNYYGGGVKIGNGGVTGSKLTIQGNAANSNSYTDTNPKLEFKNDDGRQNISLTFTDADAVQAPASLTLNGNQGNEYFIAPNIKATGNFYGNLSGKASTAGTADKTVNDISIDVPWTNESGQYVIPLGNILEPTSTAVGSPYNWDITGFFSIIRPAGHNGSHLWFEAGHGYSNDWTTYAYLDKFDFRNVTTSIKAFQYNGNWWLGLCIITGNQSYTSKMTITYSRGLPTTPTCILFYSRSNGVVNEEINNSIQDIPSSWWRTRTIHNPTTFTQDIISPSIEASSKMVIPIGAPSSLEDGCIWVER